MGITRGETKVPAPFWRRALAYIIDLFFITLLIITPFQSNLKQAKISLLGFKSLVVLTATIKSLLLPAIVLAVLVILYWAVYEYLFSQSIGKIIMNIKVNSLSKKLTFSQTLIRNLSKFSTTILLLDCLYMFFTRSNHRYLEKLSKTEVILNE